MSEFIHIEIDPELCAGAEECGKCVTVCPVNIFEPGSPLPDISETNEDECTLCELCLQSCAPHAIQIHKLYED